MAIFFTWKYLHILKKPQFYLILEFYKVENVQCTLHSDGSAYSRMSIGAKENVLFKNEGSIRSNNFNCRLM